MDNVAIEVNNTYSHIIGVLSKYCVDQIRFATSYAVPGAHFSKVYKSGYWDGRQHLFSPKKQSFPTGLLSKIRPILTQNGVSYTIKDNRIKPNPTLNLSFNPPFLLRPYQQEAIDLSYKKQRGIIRIGTGGGKTIILAGIVGKLNIPTLILTHKKDIFWQIVDTLETSLKIPIGKIGIGQVEIQNINVAMIQTISRLFDPKIKVDKEADLELDNPEEINKLVLSVGCVIVDEAHHLNLGQYETVLNNCDNAFYKIGLSATPFRTDQADIVIEAYTGPKFVDISASWLIEHGFLAAPTIYMHQFKHKRQPSNLTYNELYDSEIVRNIDRNSLIVELAEKAIDSGKTVLVAITRIEHGEILEKLLKDIEPSTFFAHGTVDIKIRKQVLRDLDSGKRKVVISTTCFGEGVDVPNLSVLISAKAADSAVDSLQLAGRVLRITPTKTTATIIDIMDTGCRYLETHSKSRLETYKLEPKYDIKIINNITLIDLK